MILDDLHGRLTITVSEAANLIGVGRDVAYAAVKDGTLPSVHLGRRVLVPVQPLLTLLGVPAPTEAPKEHVIEHELD